MFGLRRQAGKSGEPFKPAGPLDSDETLQNRIRQLTGDEYEIYKWLREFYSEHWIAETLLLGPREAKGKIKGVCRKLGVKSRRALLRVYGHLPRPLKGPVDTKEIDSYIDARTEKEIQRNLTKTQEGGNENG